MLTSTQNIQPTKRQALAVGCLWSGKAVPRGNLDRTYRSREGKSGVPPLLRRTRCRGAAGATFAASADPEASARPRDTGVGSCLRSRLATRMRMIDWRNRMMKLQFL